MRVHNVSLHDSIIRIDNQLASQSELLCVTHIGHSLSVCFNGELKRFCLPNLEYIGSNLSVSGNDLLTQASFPSLSQVAWISISRLPLLQRFEAGNLKVISHGFFAGSSPKLTHVFIPPNVGGMITISGTGLNTRAPFTTGIPTDL